MNHPSTHKMTVRLAGLIVLVIAAILTAPMAGAYTDAQDTEQESPEYRKAKELYQKAQRALTKKQYKKAADYFDQVYDRYDDSPYTADALYWRAFALHKLGGMRNLEHAREALEIQRDHYKQAASQKDAEELYYRIQSKLAAEGDSEAAKTVEIFVDESLDRDHDEYEENDAALDQKLAALHALMNMRSERAVPILKKILADRDKHPRLREQALFVLCQQDDDEALDILIDIARNDPDIDMRKHAVFWLSQNGSDETLQFLQELITDTADPEMLEQAMFSVSRHSGEKSRGILKSVIKNENIDPEARGQAIFWLGQNGRAEDIEFLKQIYKQYEDEEIKERILFSVSQNSKGQDSDWLMDIAFDENEPIEMRKMALFWASQQRKIDLNRLVKIYSSMEDREMREQVIFAISQRGDKRSVEAMIELARKETDPKLREQLVFWIGQSGHPAAEEYLLEIIND